jgi:hypothetical protein
VLAAGQFTFGFMRSSLALSFLAPQDGNRFRSASTSFSISADVAYPRALSECEAVVRFVGQQDEGPYLRFMSMKSVRDPERRVLKIYIRRDDLPNVLFNIGFPKIVEELSSISDFNQPSLILTLDCLVRF